MHTFYCILDCLLSTFLRWDGYSHTDEDDITETNDNDNINQTNDDDDINKTSDDDDINKTSDDDNINKTNEDDNINQTNEDDNINEANLANPFVVLSLCTASWFSQVARGRNIKHTSQILYNCTLWTLRILRILNTRRNYCTIVHYESQLATGKFATYSDIEYTIYSPLNLRCPSFWVE